jgi:hypothetical protein
MIKIYSKVEPEKLLHIVININEVADRIDLIPENNFLQCMIVRKDAGVKFKTHKHIYKDIDFTSAIAQESWFVYKGKIKVFHYDLDDTLIGTHYLSAGEMNVTLFGGHTFEVLENDTIVLEQKNGPYYGQALDKKFIDEQN